jgi:hypothetical protein
MNALQIIGLLVLIISVAGLLAFIFQSGKDKEEEFNFTTPEYTKEELENIKAAEEAYNKPVVAEELTVKEPEFIKPETVEKVVETSKVFPNDATINVEEVVETKPTKSEFPIDKPKKKRKYYPKKAK